MREGITASDVDALDTWLRTHGKQWAIKRIVFETGQFSTHFYHGLKAAGFPVICIDARHAHGTLKAQRIKTDKNDARGLAQIARTGWYKAVHVKSDECQSTAYAGGGTQAVSDHAYGHGEPYPRDAQDLRHQARHRDQRRIPRQGQGRSSPIRTIWSKARCLPCLKARDGVRGTGKGLDRQCADVARQDDRMSNA